MKMMTVKQS